VIVQVADGPGVAVLALVRFAGKGSITIDPNNWLNVAVTIELTSSIPYGAVIAI
jgi:hypothetical protein